MDSSHAPLHLYFVTVLHKSPPQPLPNTLPCWGIIWIHTIPYNTYTFTFNVDNFVPNFTHKTSIESFENETLTQ